MVLADIGVQEKGGFKALVKRAIMAQSREVIDYGGLDIRET